MPLIVPVLILAGAAAAAGLGLKKGYEGLSNHSRASEIVASAEHRHERARKSLEEARVLTNDRAQAFADVKIALLTGPVEAYLQLLEALKQKGKLRDVRALDRIDISADEVAAYQAAVLEAKQLANGLFLGTAGAAAASKVTLAMVGSYGVASTGAAISGLSGAAAQSATLAWLGGGSLAAGGFGMAGGMVVLGGVAVAPFFVFSGLVLAAQGQRSLTEAEEHQANINAEIHKIRTVRDFLGQVRKRMSELEAVARALGDRLSAAVASIDPDTFDLANDGHVSSFRAAASLARSVNEVLRVPVLDEQGNLTMEGYAITAKYRSLLDS